MGIYLFSSVFCAYLCACFHENVFFKDIVDADDALANGHIPRNKYKYKKRLALSK